ncbi:MAG: site-specific integrase, partial [Desulfobacterales bacterium]|nr:site-specific integrase [Desulfobacterales bacterium]
QDFRDLLICGYESGMRSSEICCLTAGQVKLDVPYIRNGEKVILNYIDLGIFDTKTGARRTVPMSESLKEIFERRLKGLAPEDSVFTNGGKPYRNVNVIVKMKFACKRAGIPYGDKLLNKKGEKAGVVFHCLRHTRTTLWVLAGFSDEIIRRATGHASLKAYQYYIKLDPSAVMRLVESETDKFGTKEVQSHG